MDMDVVGNKERLLKGILDGETTTDIEPVGHEEILLKALLEKLGGGGGGGEGEDVVIATFTIDGDTKTCDKTLDELAAAYNSGKLLVAKVVDTASDYPNYFMLMSDFFVEDDFVEISFERGFLTILEGGIRADSGSASVVINSEGITYSLDQVYLKTENFVTLTASGNNLSGDISLALLKAVLSNGVVLLSFPTEGNADKRVVAEYTDDSTNGLRIGVFSEDEYIVYSVVDDGNDGVTLTVVSEKGLPQTIELTLTSQTGGTIDNTNYTEIKKSIQNGAPLSVYNQLMGGAIRVTTASAEPTGELSLTFQQATIRGGAIQAMTLTIIKIDPNTPTQWSILATGTFTAQT